MHPSLFREGHTCSFASMFQFHSLQVPDHPWHLSHWAEWAVWHSARGPAPHWEDITQHIFWATPECDVQTIFSKHGNMCACRITLLYSQIPYLFICLLAKIMLPQIQQSWCFYSHLKIYIKWQKKYWVSSIHIPRWGRTRHAISSCFSPQAVNKHLFLWSMRCYVFHIFVLFLGNFAVINGPQVKYCLVFLSKSRLLCTLLGMGHF